MELNSYLLQMVEKKGSDLFITAGRPISMKINGIIKPLHEEKISLEESQRIISNIMSTAQLAEFKEAKESNFSISFKDVGRFRVNVFYQRESMGMVIRRIETEIPTVEQLSLPLILKEVISSKRGLILFVGGTGTGKSTTMAALIGHRNKTSSGHILTIEDPIEFIHTHDNCIVTQREVGIDTPSFDSALQNSLRQAPDVIVLGEIRNSSTMEFALQFAETGHLCIATLHANNANQAIDRIMHLVPAEKHKQMLFDLSLNLKAIVAQQLIPSIDEKSRKVAVELLISTPHIAELIKRGDIHLIKEAMAKNKEFGMQTFDQALFELYRNCEISYNEAIRSADSANDLRLMIKLSEEGTGVETLRNITYDMS